MANSWWPLANVDGRVVTLGADILGLKVKGFQDSCCQTFVQWCCQCCNVLLSTCAAICYQHHRPSTQTCWKHIQYPKADGGFACTAPPQVPGQKCNVVAGSNSSRFIGILPGRLEPSDRIWGQQGMLQNGSRVRLLQVLVLPDGKFGCFWPQCHPPRP